MRRDPQYTQINITNEAGEGQPAPLLGLKIKQVKWTPINATPDFQVDVSGLLKCPDFTKPILARLVLQPTDPAPQELNVTPVPALGIEADFNASWSCSFQGTVANPIAAGSYSLEISAGYKNPESSALHQVVQSQIINVVDPANVLLGLTITIANPTDGCSVKSPVKASGSWNGTNNPVTVTCSVTPTGGTAQQPDNPVAVNGNQWSCQFSNLAITSYSITATVTDNTGANTPGTKTQSFTVTRLPQC